MTGKLIQSIQACMDGGNLGYPVYYSHQPLGTPYPFATYEIISSPRNHTMRDSTGEPGTNRFWARCRAQFDMWASEGGQEDGLTTVLEGMKKIEDLIRYAQLTVPSTNDPNSVYANLGCLITDQHASYYDSDLKVWRMTTDAAFYVFDK